MNITVEQKDLIDALKTVSRAVKPNSPLPILSNLILNAGDEWLRVEATDYEIGLRARVPATIKEPGTLALPAKALTEIIGAFPNDTVKITADGMSGRIACRRSRHKIPGLPIEGYPAFPQPDTKQWIRLFVRENWLTSAIRQIMPALSKDETRPVLTGAHFSYSGDRIWQEMDVPLMITACDTARLALRAGTLDQVGGKNERGSAIVSGRTLQEIVKLLDPKSDAYCNLTMDERHLTVQTENRYLISRLLAGNYPHFLKVRPDVYTTRWCLGKTELLQVLKRLEPTARENLGRFRMRNKGRELLICEAFAEGATAYEETELTHEGADRNVTFNLTWVRDAIMELEGDAIWFQFADADSTVLVRSATDPTYEMILMPMASIEEPEPEE